MERWVVTYEKLVNYSLTTRNYLEYFWSRWKLLLFKAFLMRKRSIFISTLEIIFPIIFSIQIRLIFEPLALNIQHLELYNGLEVLKTLPANTVCRYTPSNEFSDKIIARVSSIFNKTIMPGVDEYDLLTSIYGRNRSVNSDNSILIIFEPTTESLPKKLNYEIRSNVYEDKREKDQYLASGFIAIQIAIERTFIELWKNDEVPQFYSEQNMTIGQFPHHNVHFPIMPSAVRPKVSLIYYLTIIAYLVIPMSALHKAIHDKKTGFKALMNLLGINSALMIFGSINYLLITAVPTAIFCTWILRPIYSISLFFLTIFILLYITVSALFIFTVGTFFIHSVKAILACILLWLAMAHFTVILDESIINSTLMIKSLSLFLPHSGLLYGLAAFTYRTDLEYEITVKPGYYQSRYYDEQLIQQTNKIPISLIIISWIFHIIIWYLIAIYLDNIYPGKFGTRKPWYYLCKQKSNDLQDIYITMRGSTNWSAVERPPQFVKHEIELNKNVIILTALTQPKVRVKKVTIEFGYDKLEVLKDMSIDFYPNEFNVILGHNGAGKSSLLKIITGIYQASSGCVYIEGRDFTDTIKLTETSKYAKPIIGYCPQENMLVNYLSAYEHLYLFGMMKGLDYKSSQEESRSLLKLFTLDKEKNLIIKKLSFSTKRRLCLAMALIGYSEILVLDEPTYAVDPQHRKRIWEILAKAKGRKTIIMATNSMEAADTLADRIAIIANSRIECCGSRSYLNKRYKIGYELTMVVKPECNLHNLKEHIQKYSLGLVTLTGKMGMMVNFNIPNNTIFPKLLNYLDANKEELRISSISLHHSSIEGQFRRIGLISHFKDRRAWFPSDRYEWIFQERRRHLIQNRKNWIRNTDGALLIQQIAAMIYKKILHVSTSWNPYLFSIIFSILALILTMTISRLTKYPHIHSGKLALNPIMYSTRNFFALAYASSDNDTQNFFQFFQQTSNNFYMNQLHIAHNKSASELMIHPELQSISFRERYFMAIDFLPNNVVKIIYSPILMHSSPISLNLFHNALIKYQSKRDDLQINLKSRPLINPEHWQYYVAHGKGVKNWENAALITTLFLLLPAVDLGVRETISLTKLLQLNTFKMNSFIYWMPVYCIDVMIYLLSLLVTVAASFFCYRHAIVVSLDFMLEMFIIFFCYGLVAIAMGYCIQMWSRTTGSAYFVIFIINIMTVLMVNPELIFPLVMHHITDYVQEYVEIFLHIFPPYVFSCAVGNFMAIKLYNKECTDYNECNSDFAIEDPCCYNCGDEFCYKPLNYLTETNTESLFHHSVLSDLVLLISQALFFHLIYIICDSNNRRKWFNPKLHGETIDIKDEDMLKENIYINQLVEDYEQSKTFIPTDVALVVKGLSKNYETKIAARDINFRINKRECFGILGMNGAGKTTIFQALIGQLSARIEKAWIYGINYSINDDKFFGMIGYCPQKAGLLDFLTGRQSLFFYAALRGIPWRHIREEVDRWLDVFDMLEFENIMIKNCAWGVRRKIGVIQCLIGDLPVIFLDDPLSGMDVISRSALNESLCQLCEMGTSIFLTTHSVDEIEALCNRVGILVDGYLITTGTCERLVEKQGNKYVITIILQPQTSPEIIEAINELVERTIPLVKFAGKQLDALLYEFYKILELETVFDIVNDIKCKHPSIVDYFINQQTLVQVFENISSSSGLTTQRFLRKSIVEQITELLNRLTSTRTEDN